MTLTARCTSLEQATSHQSRFITTGTNCLTLENRLSLRSGQLLQGHLRVHFSRLSQSLCSASCGQVSLKGSSLECASLPRQESPATRSGLQGSGCICKLQAVGPSALEEGRTAKRCTLLASFRRARAGEETQRQSCKAKHVFCEEYPHPLDRISALTFRFVGQGAYKPP